MEWKFGEIKYRKIFGTMVISNGDECKINLSTEGFKASGFHPDIKGSILGQLSPPSLHKTYFMLMHMVVYQLVVDMGNTNDVRFFVIWECFSSFYKNNIQKCFPTTQTYVGRYLGGGLCPEINLAWLIIFINIRQIN